jgi:hypothetical protein
MENIKSYDEFVNEEIDFKKLGRGAVAAGITAKNKLTGNKNENNQEAGYSLPQVPFKNKMYPLEFNNTGKIIIHTENGIKTIDQVIRWNLRNT